MLSFWREKWGQLCTLCIPQLFVCTIGKVSVVLHSLELVISMGSESQMRFTTKLHKIQVSLVMNVSDPKNFPDFDWVLCSERGDKRFWFQEVFCQHHAKDGVIILFFN